MDAPARTWPPSLLPLLGLLGPAIVLALHRDMLRAPLGLAWLLLPAVAAAVSMALLLRRITAGRRISGAVVLIAAALPWVAAIARLVYSRSVLLEASDSGGWAYPSLMAVGVGESARFWSLGLLGSAGLCAAACVGVALGPVSPERPAARGAFSVLAGWLALLGAAAAVDLAESSALLASGPVPPHGASLSRAGQVHAGAAWMSVVGSVAAAAAILVTGRRATRSPRSLWPAVASGLVAAAIAASIPLSLQAVRAPIDEATRAAYRPWQVVPGFEPAAIPGHDEGGHIEGRAFWAGLAGRSMLVVGRSWAAIVDTDGLADHEPARLRRHAGGGLATLFREVLEHDGRQERREMVVEGRHLPGSPCVEVALDGRLGPGEVRTVLASASDAGVRSLLFAGRTPDSLSAVEQARVGRTLPLVAPFTLLRASVPVVLASSFEDAPPLEPGLRAADGDVPAHRRPALLRVRVRGGETAASLLRTIGELRSPQRDRLTIVLLDATPE